MERFTDGRNRNPPACALHSSILRTPILVTSYGFDPSVVIPLL